MTDFILPLAAGFGTGILSAWGVGGGTLLLLIMTLFLGVDQATARGINLLYFLPTAALGLVEHKKNGLLDKRIIYPAALWGLPAAALGAYLATKLDTNLLRRPFGIFLIITGVLLLLEKKKS